MKVRKMTRSISTAIALGFAFILLPCAANATGTATVQQSDGTTKVYKNVVIAIRDQQMEVTTSDGVGTLVIGKAACTKVAELVECLPYDATLYQGGHKVRIMLKSGTVWLNPTTSSQPLSMTSARLAPHGVLVSATTKRGTYFSLTGTVDRMTK
jgi:hypothetical protein